MKKQSILLAVCLVAITGLAAVYFYNTSRHKPIRYLPYFGKSKPLNGDTVYHTVPDFDFLSQDAKHVTRNEVKGKIFVADYFFTTCGTICPVMKKQMHRVYNHYIGDDEIVFLSHTVNPENDTVEVLKEFAGRFNARPDKWYFLTGDKKKLYEMARQGYLLDDGSGDGGHEDFIHTQNFALVDKEFHIRGYYDGTDSVDINRLIREIDLLKQEYREVR